jgi:uncharacterized repeat protein (TIGR02543 family)
MVAAKLHNALSTSGFSLKTTKSGKGNVSVELTGHVSLQAQDTMPMTFYTSDQKLVTVTFESNGGTPVEPVTVTSGSLITEPEDPTKVGYDFAGWYTDAAFTNAFDFDTTGAYDDMTLYAKWTEQ